MFYAYIKYTKPIILSKAECHLDKWIHYTNLTSGLFSFVSLVTITVGV